MRRHQKSVYPERKGYKPLIALQHSRNQATGSRAFAVATAVLCLFLLLLLSFGQVAHIHATSAEADHCPLCFVLHSAAPIAVAAPVVIVLVPLRSPVVVQEVRPVFRSWHPSQFTRPPPACC
jgi:hypothetical protein